jgi:hypothetical protein
MTVIKLDGQPSAAARAALEPYAEQLYANQGLHLVAVVEMAHLERTEPAPDAQRERTVRVRITGMEVARGEQERALREAQRALHLHRTAYGSLTEHGDVELSQRTLELTAGELHAVEAARLRAAALNWQGYLTKLLGRSGGLSKAEVLHEVDLAARGLAAALHLADDDDGREQPASVYEDDPPRERLPYKDSDDG